MKRLFQMALIALSSTGSFAQDRSTMPVTVTGAVVDESTRLTLINRVREVYGAERVRDQTTVGSVVAPPNWNTLVQKLITPALKQVSNGQLVIDGNMITISGEVQNETIRQQIVSEMATSLNSSYTIKNSLRVAASEQSVLDRILANRVVEFESGSAHIAPVGIVLLDELADAMVKMKGIKFEIVGHTDNSGSRQHNLALSQARAEAVKLYLQQKGIAADAMNAIGMGPDQPVALNNSDAGKKKNRRIEFRASR